MADPSGYGKDFLSAIPYSLENESNSQNLIYFRVIPDNSNIQIHYRLVNARCVTISVANLLGQIVATFVNRDDYVEIDNSITWDASGQSAGVYFFTITTGGDFAARKAVILH